MLSGEICPVTGWRYDVLLWLWLKCQKGEEKRNKISNLCSTSTLNASQQNTNPPLFTITHWADHSPGTCLVQNLWSTFLTISVQCRMWGLDNRTPPHSVTPPSRRGLKCWTQHKHWTVQVWASIRLVQSVIQSLKQSLKASERVNNTGWHAGSPWGWDCVGTCVKSGTH